MLEKRHIIDLTRVIDENLEIYSEGKYADPEYRAETWCTVETQGYWVSRISLGTQTGTHIDAPAHFKPEGETLESLPVERFLGSYFYLNLDLLSKGESIDDLLSDFADHPILFLFSSSGETELTASQLDRLCSLPTKVWAVVGTVRVMREKPLFFHRHLAKKGIFLIEDLDTEASQQVKPGGELIALPLRLHGVSGSPCRVLVVQ